MKKLISFIIVGILVFSLVGCTTDKVSQDNNDTEVVEELEDKPEELEEISLEAVNKFLNESGDLGPGSIANKVSVIPFKHIDGPKQNSDFYAFVNFEYQARDFVKYQVSFVSCT